ncbi:MAG TPA: MFS transporter, partial [Candidatus Limnocylindria bacterium]|nr:MFS transporter [Candidatus Limnocylindria bacterium]
MTTDAAPEAAGKLAALGYRDFRLFWSGQLISNIGTWMQMTATSWLLYQLTGSAVLLGLNGIFRAVPALTLGLISGTFADRCDRRWMLLWTQVILGSLSLAIGVLDDVGHIQPWHIYSFTFLSAAVGAFDGPARQAMFPALVPRSALPNAVALNSLLWKGSALIGPSLGGVAISLMGTAGAFYANALSFLVVVITLLMLRVTAKAAAKRQRHFMAETQEGFKYIVARPIILGITIMEAVASVFGLDHTMLTIYASDVLRVGADGFGLLQSARGLGAVIGSGLFLAVGQKPYQGNILIVTAILYGIFFGLFGLAPTFAIALALMTLIGLTDTVWGAARGTIMQMITPDNFRGRVMGVFQLSNRGLHPLGQVESGLLIPLIGVRETTLFGGILVTVVTLLTAWKVPAIAQFRWDDAKYKSLAE